MKYRQPIQLSRTSPAVKAESNPKKANPSICRDSLSLLRYTLAFQMLELILCSKMHFLIKSGGTLTYEYF